ncbi:MAG: GNAT family N-acetyltransferase [Amylibacter sp.]
MNEIIKIGGLTAIETPLSHQGFCDYFLSGICCFGAENSTGILMGFQALEHHTELPQDCADIATFVKHSTTQSGIGTALFQHTLRHAQQRGIDSINATIRQDNASGIAYYSRMGFTDHSVIRDVPLLDGTKVNRISKRYAI